jgi:hypothetical protein
MSYLLKEFDEVRKNIKTDAKGIEALKVFRKSLKRTEKHSDKFGEYFDRSLNSGEMSDGLAKSMGLL